MKKFRVLVPIFSFGLILAFAWLSQKSVGSNGFLSVSEVYAASSKNFSAISTEISIVGFSFKMPTPIFSILVLFVVVGIFIFFYVLILKRNKKNLPSQDQSNEDL